MNTTMSKEDELIQDFINCRANCISAKNRMYAGDVFYSDISYFVKITLKLKGLQATKMFMKVCDTLRDKNYWVHS
jgi:hypothetical protein